MKGFLIYFSYKKFVLTIISVRFNVFILNEITLSDTKSIHVYLLIIEGCNVKRLWGVIF